MRDVVSMAAAATERCRVWPKTAAQDVQGGSNMTGTDAACLHTNQSRSYLNHLVCTGALPWFRIQSPSRHFSSLFGEMIHANITRHPRGISC